jgi:hypothetical protein
MPDTLPSISKGIGKRCIVCGNIIPKSAVKCVGCGSFQDWRRYLNFSTTMVALLTALVSVIASSAPTIKNLFEGHDSKLAVAFQGDDGQGGVLFLVSNDGDRPGGIAETTLIVPINHIDYKYPGQVDERVSDTLISPQQNKQIRIMFDLGAAIKQPSQSDLTGDCKIDIAGAEFSGKTTPFEFARPCTNFSMVHVTSDQK